MFTFNKTSRLLATALMLGASSLCAANTNTMTVEEQKQYKPSDIAFCIDPNVGLIWDNLDPAFTITYKNASGKTLTRNYQASIDTVGFKLDASIHFNLVFFTDSANDYYESNKVLTVGQGIEIHASWTQGLHIVYAPFTNAPGGLLLVGVALGLDFPALCLVQGGTLTPVK